VLYRSGPHRQLELLRSIGQTRAVVTMQAVGRGYLARRLAAEVRRLAPIIRAALGTRDLDNVAAVLAEADALAFVTADHAKLRRLRFVLAEERRIAEVLKRLDGLVGSGGDDALLAAVTAADEVEMTGRPDVEKARGHVERVRSRRECLANIEAGNEAWDQDVLEAELARVDALGLGSHALVVRAREIVAILVQGTSLMERMVAALRADCDDPGTLAALTELAAENAATPPTSPPAAQLALALSLTLRLRNARSIPDWDEVESVLREAEGCKVHTEELDRVRAEAAQMVDEGRVVSDLDAGAAEMDHVKLGFALEAAQSKGLNDHPSAVHARELLAWIENVRGWLDAAVTNVDESQLVYAVELADSGSYNTLEVQTCRTLRDKVVALNAQAKAVLETLEPAEMQTVLAGLREVKCTTEDSTKIDELLNRTPKAKFLQLQLKAATRLGDTARTIDLTVRIKDDFFSGNEASFALENYDGYKSPALFAKAYTFGKDKVKLGFWLHSKKPIATSLLRLDAFASKLAVRMFKSLLVYTGERSGSYPDALLSDIIATAIEHPAVRDEVYAQVLKQLSGREVSPTSARRARDALRMLLRTVPPGDAYANHLEVWLMRNGPELRPVLHRTLYGGAAQSAPTPEVIKAILATPIAEDTAGMLQPQQQPQGQQTAAAAADAELNFPAPPSSAGVPIASRGAPPPPPPV
jgi:hypothetical protein